MITLPLLVAAVLFRVALVLPQVSSLYTTNYLVEYANENYTILSSYSNVSGASNYAQSGHVFGDSCRQDLGSELASFHSDVDYFVSYFDNLAQLESYQEWPYGLNWLDCKIGAIIGQNQELEWMDGTPYDWGRYNSSSSQWDASYSPESTFDCVRVDNNKNKKQWLPYNCGTEDVVHCGVCKTPPSRSYTFGIAGTIQTTRANQLNNTFLYAQFSSSLGTGLQGTMRLNIDFASLANAVESEEGLINFSYTYQWENATNIGPIANLTLLMRDNGPKVNITYLEMNYLQHDFDASEPIEFNTNVNSTGQQCLVTEVEMQYAYKSLEHVQKRESCGHYVQSGLIASQAPTMFPTQTAGPSEIPTRFPTIQPSEVPTVQPVQNELSTAIPITTSTGIDTSYKWIHVSSTSFMTSTGSRSVELENSANSDVDGDDGVSGSVNTGGSREMSDEMITMIVVMGVVLCLCLSTCLFAGVMYRKLRLERLVAESRVQDASSAAQQAPAPPTQNMSAEGTRNDHSIDIVDDDERELMNTGDRIVGEATNDGAAAENEQSAPKDAVQVGVGMEGQELTLM